MAIAEREIDTIFVSEEEIRHLVAEVNQRMGFVPDPTPTAQKALEMMRVDGIRPADNVFTSDLMRMRYEED